MHLTFTTKSLIDNTPPYSLLRWQEASLPNQCARPLSGGVEIPTYAADYIIALAADNARLKHAVNQAGFHCAGVPGVDNVSHRCLAVLRGEWFDNVTARG